MLATSAYRGAFGASRRPLASFLSGPSFPLKKSADADGQSCVSYSTIISSAASSANNATNALTPSAVSPSLHYPMNTNLIARRTLLSSSSFSALPPDEEEKEKARVDSLTDSHKEMELRKLDEELARLQTIRAINTGELYTLRGKFKMLSRDYGMGFLAWYWAVWFGTAGLSYAAIELGGVDPLWVAAQAENFLGWEAASISGRIDPTMGQIALVVAANECLEPLRLPFVVVTTKPVVNFFSKSY